MERAKVVATHPVTFNPAIDEQVKPAPPSVHWPRSANRSDLRFIRQPNFAATTTIETGMVGAEHGSDFIQMTQRPSRARRAITAAVNMLQ